MLTFKASSDLSKKQAILARIQTDNPVWVDIGTYRLHGFYLQKYRVPGYRERWDVLDPDKILIESRLSMIEALDWLRSFLTEQVEKQFSIDLN